MIFVFFCQTARNVALIRLFLYPTENISRLLCLVTSFIQRMKCSFYCGSSLPCPTEHQKCTWWNRATRQLPPPKNCTAKRPVLEAGDLYGYWWWLQWQPSSCRALPSRQNLRRHRRCHLVVFILYSRVRKCCQRFHIDLDTLMLS